MHYEITLYSLFCIAVSLFYHKGTLTTFLLVQLFAIHQYFYYQLFIEKKVEGNVCYCVECEDMTNETFIHCKECNKCVPVTYFHWEQLKTCVSYTHAKRYMHIIKLIAGTNILCSLMESFAYLPFLVVTILSCIVLKSTASSITVNI
jgi:hypothetical protein